MSDATHTKKSIFVTGGLGYIGSHTVVELQMQGYRTVILDNLSNTRQEVALGIEKITGVKPDIYIGDVRDRSMLDRIFRENNDIAAVIHFAADKAVGESVENPLKYYNNNIGGLVTLLETMGKFNVNRMVFSSSCTVYGEPENVPVDENSPVVEAASPYGNTKKISEEILTDVTAQSNLKACCLRYFNPVGAHESAQIGELPLGIPNNLVPFITQTAAGLRDELTVFGDDYNTPDGTCIRDYIHVMDLAAAHVKAIDYLEGQEGGVSFFNIGTGTGSSVLEVVKAFEEVSDQKLPYKIGPRRSGDIEQIWAKTDLAKEVLGWEARRDLKDMMAAAWAWQKSLGDKSRGS